MKRTIVLILLMILCDITTAQVPVETGLVSQFDGDHVSVDVNGFVTSWTDQSGRNNHAIPMDSNHPRAPYVQLNELAGHNVLDLNSTEGYYKCLGIPSNPTDFDKSTFTWFVVYKVGNDQQTRNMLCTNYTSPSTAARFWGTYQDYSAPPLRMISNARNDSGSSIGDAGHPGQAISGWNIMSTVWDSGADSTDGQIHQYLNGKKNSQFTTSLTSPTVSGHIATVIGAAFSYDSETQVYSFSSLFGGQIAELLIYNVVLTEEQIEQVGSYLANKYGIYTIYTPTTCEGLWAWKQGNSRDANKDCTFDVFDLDILAEQWLATN